MLISYTWASWLFSDNYTASAVAFTNMIGVIIVSFRKQLVGTFLKSVNDAISSCLYAIGSIFYCIIGYHVGADLFI